MDIDKFFDLSAQYGRFGLGLGIVDFISNPDPQGGNIRVKNGPEVSRVDLDN
jgi:hypothetical protein